MNQYGEITDVVEKPDDPPSNRGEYEISDVDLLIQSGRTIDVIPLDGWRIDVGYSEDREDAEARLERKFEAGKVVADSADGD